MNFARQRLLKSAGLGSLSLGATSVLLSTPSGQAKERLPIYSHPDQEIVLQEVPSELERQIGVVRRQVTATYRDGYKQVQGLVDRWIGMETAVENRLKSLMSPDESLTPSVLYIGVATLTGSILTRSRSLPLRLTVPPLLLALSSSHFLPKTTSNVTSYFGSLEDKYLPSLAEKHNIAKAHSEMTWERAKEMIERARNNFEGGVVGGVGKVQEVTGLKLGEVWKLGGKEREASVKGLEEKAIEASKDVNGKVVEITKAVEEKVQAQVVQAARAIEKKIEEAGPDTATNAERKEQVKRLV
ncbi:apolipo protein O-domain-containing protein [Lentinula aff. detonsa]|uniref:MICOS complex subunit n=1 Tax=Lentinula aff. detonsa TaxID=2804958 RepID=A0AA38KGF4_9AGAR|nr:apolipo protein O-domain-containing protein [Lentinula aff. detonsa]